MAYKTNYPVEQLGQKTPYNNSVSTQKKRILSYLEKNHRLSTMEAPYENQ